MKKYMIEQKGRSMIEMLGVLAIVGVLSVAGIAGYSKAMTKYKINKVMDEVSTIAANTKTMFAATGLYKDLGGQTGETVGSKVAYELGLFPEEMIKSCASSAGATDAAGTCVLNGLGGDTILKTADDDGTAFSLVMNGLTTEACTALVTSDWGGTSGFKYLKASKAAQTVLPATPAGTANTDYIKPTASASQTFAYAVTANICDCTGSTCSVGWVFY